MKKRLSFIIALNIIIVAAELIGGVLSGSLALLSDAVHVFADLISIILAYIAIHWSRKPKTEKRSFGYHRLEILAAFTNGLLLVIISCYIMIEALNRFFSPVPIQTGLMLAVAVFGLLGNLAGVFLLKDESHHNLNIRGAFLHLLSDTLSSFAVIAGGVIIIFTGLKTIDSIMGIFISIMIFRGALKLLMESSEILLESTPKELDTTLLKKTVEAIPGVKAFNHVHIWTITSGKRALSGRIITENLTTIESNRLICSIKEVLFKDFLITHATIETECKGCKNHICEFD